MVNSCTYSFHLCCWTFPNSIGSIPPHAAFVLGYMGKPLKSRTAEQLGPFQLNSADFELIEWGMWYLAIHFALTRRELSCSQAYAFVKSFNSLDGERGVLDYPHCVDRRIFCIISYQVKKPAAERSVRATNLSRRSSSGGVPSVRPACLGGPAVEATRPCHKLI
jgi:hypothetical protein